jgi:Rod binding domain-containing protein
MNSIAPTSSMSGMATGLTPAAGAPDLQGTFQKAVAGLFFGELLKSLRSTVGEPAYIHGGQAEKLFEGQLDQILSENLATTQGGAFVGELYDQFRAQLGLPLEKSAQAAETIQADSSRWSSQPLKPVLEARSGTQSLSATTATAPFSGLFRK